MKAKFEITEAAVSFWNKYNNMYVSLALPTHVRRPHEHTRACKAKTSSLPTGYTVLHTMQYLREAGGLAGMTGGE